MNFTKNLFESHGGQRRFKPHVVMLTSVGAFALFFLTVILLSRQNAEGRKAPEVYVVGPSLPQKELPYDFVHVDTIPYGSHVRPMTESQQPAPAVIQKTPAPTGETASTSRQAAQPAATHKFNYVAPPATATRSPAGSRNMIVLSDYNNTRSVSGGSRVGLQSVLLKVMLPSKTSIRNNSLVDARVIKGGTWGNVEIPRRSQLLGRARLQNSRVQIIFDQLRIGDRTHSCNGRAYDLKNLEGLPYAPLGDRTRQIVYDQLKNTVSGVPIVGDLAKQPDVNPFNEEAATLEEGLEFFIEINNVF